VARKIGPRLVACFVADLVVVEVEFWACTTVVKTQSSSRVSVRIFFICSSFLCEARRSARVNGLTVRAFGPKNRRYDTAPVKTRRGQQCWQEFNGCGRMLECEERSTFSPFLPSQPDPRRPSIRLITSTFPTPSNFKPLQSQSRKPNVWCSSPACR